MLGSLPKGMTPRLPLSQNSSLPNGRSCREESTLTTDEQRALWTRLTSSLHEFQALATTVAGETAPPTGRRSMLLPGHRQLHRETN
eukprot:996453-Rhodomonas_salina.1